MPEQPIETIGEILQPQGDGIFTLTLLNGKVIHGHLPKRLAGLADSIAPGSKVHLEMTPYDFEKGRIVSLVDHV